MMDEERERPRKVDETVHERGGIRRAADLFEDGMIVLRGERMMTVHGCKKILLYSTERIRLRMRRRKLSVYGGELCCTSFSGGVITIEGEIDGVQYERGKGDGE